jgi:hypothetical protein
MWCVCMYGVCRHLNSLQITLQVFQFIHIILLLLSCIMNYGFMILFYVLFCGLKSHAQRDRVGYVNSRET